MLQQILEAGDLYIGSLLDPIERALHLGKLRIGPKSMEFIFKLSLAYFTCIQNRDMPALKIDHGWEGAVARSPSEMLYFVRDS